MNADIELLYLESPVGKGQENNPDDVEALDGRLRRIGAYRPPTEYADIPQRYATEPMIDALERYQEQNGLKIDGVVNPGGPTERAINNRLLGKPRGAGLLYDPPPPLGGTVGNGFENRRKDVANIQRQLGALDFLPEDPFDQPRGFIDEPTTNGVKAFQRVRGLVEDGWLAPGGETERALGDAISDLARVKSDEWLQFIERAGRAQRALLATHGEQADDHPPTDVEDADIVAVRGPPPGPMPPPGQIGGFPRRFGPRGLIEIDPRYKPGPRFDPRRTAPGPTNPEWVDPNAPPPIAPRPLIRPGPTPGEAGSIEDLPRDSSGLPESSLLEEARRALTIPRRPSAEPDVYVPQPGSPLRIPVLDIHHGGIWGDQRTIQTTKDATDAIEEACRKIFKNAEFVRKTEKHYPPWNQPEGTRKGGSFADEGMVMFKAAKNVTINFVTDTYTAKVDGSPIAAEDKRFLNLQYNRSGEEHTVTVRVPKVWPFGQALDKDKLQAAAKEICEQIKNTLNEGVGPDKRLRIEQTLKKLVEPKKKPAPEVKEPAEPRK